MGGPSCKNNKKRKTLPNNNDEKLIAKLNTLRQFVDLFEAYAFGIHDENNSEKINNYN